MRIEIGSGEYPKDGYTHMDCREGLPHQEVTASIFDMPFEDNSIEEIALSLVLEHIPTNEVSKALSEIYRVLEVGGIVKISVPNLIELSQMVLDKSHPFEVLVIWFYGGQDYPENFHKTGFSPESLTALLVNAGFTINKCVAIDGLHIEAEK